jgi:xanthine/uracil/vitamin C permease (AzgA family)
VQALLEGLGRTRAGRVERRRRGRIVSRHLDAEVLAYLAIVGICLVLIGAVLTAGPVTIEQRGAVLTGIIATLFAVGWRAHRRGLLKLPGEDEEAPR